MKIQVSGSDIKIVKDELVVTGALNAYEVEFKFDKSWNQMSNKTAVFYQPSVNRDNPICLIIEDNKVMIPAGSLVEDDYLYVGVFGFNESGTIRLPTIYTYVYVNQGCFKLNETPEPPNKSVYEQIYNMALKAYSTAQSVKDDADSGKFDGYSPEIIIKENTPTSYILTISTKDGSYDTPNLLGGGGSDPSVVYLTKDEASKIYVSKSELRDRLSYIKF